jgi:hypothetical protein
MNEQGLIDRLTRRMNLDKVPDPILEEARNVELIKDVLDPKKLDRFEDLLDFARDRMRFHKDMQKYEQRHAIVRTESENIKSLEDTESTSQTDTQASEQDEAAGSHVLRAAALEEYLAMIAASERDVYAFRTRFLPDGQTISLKEASALIASPLAARLPANRVRPSIRSLIPLSGHSAASDAAPIENEENPRTFVEVSADPLREPTLGADGTQERLLFTDKDDHVQVVKVRRLSVLDKLRRRSVRLARHYPWEEAEASCFILTGKIPKMPAVVGRLHASRDPMYTYGTITLTVQPWVPADVVYRFYRDMRQGAFAGEHRTVSDRKIAVFRFVVSQYEIRPPEHGKPKYRIVDSPVGPVPRLSHKTRAKILRKPQLVKPKWKVMLDRWNERYSDLPYKWSYKDEANFKRDFHEARKTIVHPQYDFQVDS